MDIFGYCIFIWNFFLTRIFFSTLSYHYTYIRQGMELLLDSQNKFILNRALTGVCWSGPAMFIPYILQIICLSQMSNLSMAFINLIHQHKSDLIHDGFVTQNRNLQNTRQQTGTPIKSRFFPKPPVGAIMFSTTKHTPISTPQHERQHPLRHHTGSIKSKWE